jgi:hypothetical protein
MRAGKPPLETMIKGGFRLKEETRVGLSGKATEKLEPGKIGREIFPSQL